MKQPDYPVAARDGAQSGQRVLTPGGPLDMACVPDFLRAVREEPAPVVILDFSKVSYIDSSGVGALLQLLTGLQKAKRKLALANVSQRVTAVLDMTRVKGLFIIFATVAEAEQKLG